MFENKGIIDTQIHSLNVSKYIITILILSSSCLFPKKLKDRE